MNKRSLNLNKYGISGKRYKELCGFCEQYPEWKKEIVLSENTLQGVQYSDMPHSPNVGTSDITGNASVKIADCVEKCKLIEDTAKEASNDLWEYLIKSVCYEVPMAYLETLNMPCSRASFYDVRRYFFYLLNQNKK